MMHVFVRVVVRMCAVCVRWDTLVERPSRPNIVLHLDEKTESFQKKKAILGVLKSVVLQLISAPPL